MGKSDSTGTYSYVCDGTTPGSPILSDGHAVYTPGLSENRGGASGYYSFDRLGNMWTVDNGGTGQTYYQDTTGFGSYIAFSGSNPSGFGFSGGNGCQSDADTGLVLMGHRYYDTRTGRFISQDPAGDGDNWYAYAGNSPTNEIDPDGLMPQGIPFIWDPGQAGIPYDPNNDANPEFYSGQPGTYNGYVPDGHGGYKYIGTQYLGPTAWDQANNTMSAGSPGAGFMNLAPPRHQQPDSFWDYLKRDILSGGHADNHNFHEVPVGALIPQRGVGASGRPKLHFPKFNTKKEAFEAAKKASKGGSDPIHDANPPRGWPHYHAADETGKKIEDGIHYTYPP